VVNSAVPYDINNPPRILVERFGDEWFVFSSFYKMSLQINLKTVVFIVFNAGRT